MGKKYKRRAIDNIKFSIGAKLITIISIIVILSLGSITVLVSWLVREDLKMAAEDANFEANRRSAMEAETAINTVRSNTRILLQTITTAGPQTALARQAIEFFFTENSQTAVVFFVNPGSREQILVNDEYFSSRNMDEELAASFFANERDALGRAIRGETLITNAAPHFSRSLLALFFPNDGGVGAVIFSSETLNNNFGFGTNKSYMINSSGDILAHSDFSFVQSGRNIGNESFIRSFLTGTDRSRQQLIEVDFDFLQISENPAKTGFPYTLLDDIKIKIKPAGDFVGHYWTIAKVNVYSLLGITVKTAHPLAAKKAPKNNFLSKIKFFNKSDDEDKKIRQFVAFSKLGVAGVTVITSIEYDKVFEAITATTRRNIYLTVAVLSISIICIWFFSKTISLPLKALAAGARQIEGGVFDLELPKQGKDEIGVLTSSFQKMCSALHIFGRFTNKEIAVKAMRGLIKPGGLPKHGTVFFSDIREFTAKSEHFTNVFKGEASDKIVHWLNEYFTQMVDCIEKTNGVVDKFIGDAVMAHWGTAYSAGSPRMDAFNGVKAALMMRKALYYLNKQRIPGDPASPYIRIGCGLNSGIVTAGQLGSDMRMEYTVIGDPVNLASRIEALTKPLGADILISEDTWKLIGDKFIVEEMPSVTVKGKEKPVRIFAVVNFMGEPKGPQSLAEVRSILGIEPPILEEADVNEEEKKYKIGTK